jgi:hypothetical protein
MIDTTTIEKENSMIDSRRSAGHPPGIGVIRTRAIAVS